MEYAMEAMSMVRSRLDRTLPNGAYAGKLNFEKVSLQKLMESFSKGQQKWTGKCEGNIDLSG